MGEVDPKGVAFEELVSYKPGEKGLGEIAADILTKASRATDDAEMQHKLGLKAFLKAVPEGIGRELRSNISTPFARLWRRPNSCRKLRQRRRLVRIRSWP